MARDIHENGQCHGRHRQINRKLLSVIQCCMLDNLFLSFQSLLHTDLMLAHYFFVNSLTHSGLDIMSSYVLVPRVIMDIFSHVFIICTSNVVIHECEARVNTTLRVQIMNTSEKISIITRDTRT